MKPLAICDISPKELDLLVCLLEAFFDEGILDETGQVELYSPEEVQSLAMRLMMTEDKASKGMTVSSLEGCL